MSLRLTVKYNMLVRRKVNQTRITLKKLVIRTTMYQIVASLTNLKFSRIILQMTLSYTVTIVYKLININKPIVASIYL